MMQNHKRKRWSESLCAKIVTGIALISSAPSFAQMQIPNPLVQPAAHRPILQKEDPKGAMPPLPAQPDSLVGRQAMPFPQSMGGPMGGLADSSQFSNGNSKTPFAEIREKLSMFYVSAIVGDRAILRRSPVQPAGTIAGVPGNPMMGPPGMMGGAIAQAPKPPSGQSETMTVTDGEPIDFIGDGITLIPRVTSSRVSIYYADDVARAKKGARRKVVFLGQVESIVTSPPAPIVLEKPDPTYKQRVSVETKSRSINNNQAQGQNPPNNLPQPLSN